MHKLTLHRRMASRFAQFASRRLSTFASAAGVEIRNVYCIGRNYAAHARELNNPVPTEEPVIFLKSSTSVRPDAFVEAPSASNSAFASGPLAHEHETFSYEVELVLLVGKHLPLGALADADAAAAVKAVTAVGLGLDLTRRGKQSELKKAGLPWTLSKSFAGAALLTPFTENDGSFSLDDIEFELAVNGDLRQRGHVNQMIFDIPFMLRFLNNCAPLVPGDLLFTGTPEGVGPISRGDHCRLKFVGGPTATPSYVGLV